MQSLRNRNRRDIAGRGLASWLSAAILAAAPVAGMAEEPSAPAVVGLDQLLRLPDSLELETETRGGATEAEWRARFQTARNDVAAARDALAKTQERLTELAGGNSSWKMGAPGLGAVPPSSTDTPLDYNLSQEMRKNREELERSERRLAELQVEANLAGVPEEWQEPERRESE